MTRFQPQGTRVAFELPDAYDVKRETPGKQLIGLYGAWRSLSPETRDWIMKKFGMGKKQEEPRDASEEQIEDASNAMAMMDLNSYMPNTNEDLIWARLFGDDPITQQMAQSARNFNDTVRYNHDLDQAQQLALTGEPIVSWDSVMEQIMPKPKINYTNDEIRALGKASGLWE